MTRIIMVLVFLFPFVVYSQPYPSKPVVVENRGGAIGTIGADLVAKSLNS